MLRHVVTLRFSEDAGDVDRIADDVVEALRHLPSAIPAIRSYTVERDLGLADDNAHVVVIADFDDEAGHAAYSRHPEHRAVIDSLIAPALESRSAVQFRL